MKNEILFKERQRFKQWWVWLMLISINCLFLFGVFKQVVFDQPFGNKPMNNIALIIVTVFTICLTVLFLNFRLDTIIRKDGIYVRFFPFHLKTKHYTWASLTKIYLREYSPLTAYGGWGVRTNLFGNGSAYNVSGDMGLQLEFANNNKLLIGTNKPDELKAVLNKLGVLKA